MDIMDIMDTIPILPPPLLLITIKILYSYFYSIYPRGVSNMSIMSNFLAVHRLGVSIMCPMECP